MSTDLKEKMARFKKRWNVVDDASYEENFRKFRTRIISILNSIDNHVREDGIELFCQHYGISETWHTPPYEHSYSTSIIDKLKATTDEVEFYELLEFIFTLDIVGGYGPRGVVEYSKDILLRKVIRAIDFSEINLAISIHDDEIIFHPKGEEKLDHELVDHVLSFLDQKSSKHFIDALKDYQKKRGVKSAEALRRSLEEFLRSKLGNSKGLDANIEELLKKLKEGDRDPQVRNIIFQTFTYLDQYYNENSKHKDGAIDDSENEFLIYQTGVLMRYVDANL